MGWTFSNWSRNELIELLVESNETETHRFETLAYSLRDNVLWSVIQCLPKPPAGAQPPAELPTTIIGCTLLERSSGWWGYKAMKEEGHPFYYNCPLRYLKMAPEQSPAWREGVRTYHARRRATALPVRALPIGQPAFLA